MIRSVFSASLLLTLAVGLAACGSPPVPVQTNTSTNSPAPASAMQGQSIPAPTSSVPGNLSFKTPDGWKSEQPSSNMRAAQYKVPGDAGDASLVVYYFGQGQGGSVDDNFDRWIGQMGQTRAGAKTEKLTVNGMDVTLLDVSGTYSGDMGGGGPVSNARMRAGVIETPKGRYFIKLTGPEKTVTHWDDSFVAFMKSAEFKK